MKQKKKQKKKLQQEEEYKQSHEAQNVFVYVNILSVLICLVDFVVNIGWEMKHIIFSSIFWLRRAKEDFSPFLFRIIFFLFMNIININLYCVRMCVEQKLVFCSILFLFFVCIQKWFFLAFGVLYVKFEIYFIINFGNLTAEIFWLEIIFSD